MRMPTCGAGELASSQGAQPAQPFPLSSARRAPIVGYLVFARA